MGESKPPTENALQLRIREFAYLLWEAAGREHGRSLEYWLEAERALLGCREAMGKSPPKADAVSSTPPPEEK